MTFSRCLKYKWKGNRWSVAIVAAEKSSAFEFPVIRYIHVINANAGWAFLSLYNVCSITTSVTKLRNFGHATSHGALHRALYSRASLPTFFAQLFDFVSTSLFEKHSKLIAMKERNLYHIKIFT